LIFSSWRLLFQVNRALEDNLVKAVDFVQRGGFGGEVVRKRLPMPNRVMLVLLVSTRAKRGKQLVYHAYQERLQKARVFQYAICVPLDGTVTIQKVLLARVVQLVNDP